MMAAIFNTKKSVNIQFFKKQMNRIYFFLCTDSYDKRFLYEIMTKVCKFTNSV